MAYNDIILFRRLKHRNLGEPIRVWPHSSVDCVASQDTGETDYS